MIEKISFHGWNNCYRLSNGNIELVLATDFGPRILSLAFFGSENIFHENAEDLGKTGGDQWRRYCGHRFCHAPEAKARINIPENNGVQIEPKSYWARLFQYTERATGIQKELEIFLDPHDAHVSIKHRLCNNGAFPVELAAWAITDMADGGVGIFPLPDRIIHDPDNFHPPHPLIIWDYTNMNDPRWKWGNRYVMLRDDQALKGDQRVGMEVRAGWTAYAVHNQLFVKKYSHFPNGTYPGGCSSVLFAGSEAFQLETFGPITTLEPKESLNYTEEWFLYNDIPLPQAEADIDHNILPKIEQY